MITCSCGRHKGKKYTFPNTSTPKNHAQCISAMPVSLLNLNTPTNLTSVGKEYMCIKIDNKPAQAARCVKPRIMTKVIDCILYIDKFEQQFVVLKVMLKSPYLKDHIKTIGIG